jgi:hypothetical protein
MIQFQARPFDCFSFPIEGKKKEKKKKKKEKNRKKIFLLGPNYSN